MPIHRILRFFGFSCGLISGIIAHYILVRKLRLFDE